MQREKLYKLQSKVYFNRVFSVFKKTEKLRATNLLPLGKTGRTEFETSFSIKSTEIK